MCIAHLLTLRIGKVELVKDIVVRLYKAVKAASSVEASSGALSWSNLDAFAYFGSSQGTKSVVSDDHVPFYDDY